VDAKGIGDDARQWILAAGFLAFRCRRNFLISMSIRPQKQIALLRLELTVKFPVERGAVWAPALAEESKPRTPTMRNILAGSTI
jgi:hypothetical protein